MVALKAHHVLNVVPPEADLHREQLVRPNHLCPCTARACWQHNAALGHRIVDHDMCACGHLTQLVQHVVVDCVIHKSSYDGFPGVRSLDAGNRTWLK